ncbi:MAG: zinc ribbon domain-containing protein [Chthoniobacterales bacterium]|nr:zinc ribbon domain-containing protein [Chthoniobacterales bacterium]
MPTYEYVCKKCNQTFEVFQSMKDEPLQFCPEDLCQMGEWGQGEVKRLIGPGAGLLFKGSGFYITDYRSENYKAAAKKETAATSGTKNGTSGTNGASASSSGTTSSTKTD